MIPQRLVHCDVKNTFLCEKFVFLANTNDALTETNMIQICIKISDCVWHKKSPELKVKWQFFLK